MLSAALASGASVVIADMAGTTFCDSTGVRVLVQARQQAVADHAGPRVVVPHTYVRRGGRMGAGELLVHLRQLSPGTRSQQQPAADPG